MTNSYRQPLSEQDLIDQQLLALEQQEQQEEALTPSETGKQGPDFVPGERQAAEAALEQVEEAQQGGQKDIYGNPWPPNFEEEREQSAEIAEDITVGTIEGLIDTALGLTTIQEKGYELLGKIPNALGLDPNNQFKPPMPMTWLQNEWDKANPISEDEPLHATIRKVSGVAIPTILGSGIAVGAVKATPWFLGLSGKAKLATEIATHLGIDMVVTTASTSATDETLATILHENFGWNVPWVTKTTDSPEVKYWKQMFETGALSTGVDLLGIVFNAVKPTKFLAKTPEAEAFLAKRAARETEVTTEALTSPTLREVNQQIDEILEARPNIAEEIAQSKNFDDPDWVRLDELTSQESKLVTAEILEAPPGAFTESAQNNYLRGQAQTEEALRRLELDPTGVNGYDPFINTPADPIHKAIPHPKADPVEAVVDHATMQKYPSINGRAAPVVTESFQKAFMQAKDGSERAQILNELFLNMPKQLDAVLANLKTISEEDMTKAVNSLATNILGQDVKSFAKDLATMKKDVIRGQKFLDDESFVVLAKAFRSAFDIMFDPNNVRASALMVEQAANTVSDAARVAGGMDEFFDVSRQMEIAWDNLELLATEIRASQSIAGRTLEAKKLIKSINDNPRVAIKLQENREAFEAGMKISREKARETIQTLKDITKNHSEYRQAFIAAFDSTDGDVHTLDLLFRYADDNLSIIRKGIYDQNPEVPSLILKGLNGVRHNSILSGLSAVRALTGNLTMTTVKPISVLAGSAPKAVFGDAYQFKRALATYGGLMENLTRARKVMWTEWKLAVANPQEAMRRGRADFNFKADEGLEVMELMKKGFQEEGKYWAVARINMAQQMSFWNNNPIVRWGVNAMYSIDGFTGSMMASGNARAKAFDALFDKSYGAFNKADFEKMQKKLYDEAFDANGVLTDEATKHATSEVALNLDNVILQKLDPIMDAVPALKTIFLFPRTGLNAVNLAWSFVPGSSLGPGLTKAQRVFRATSEDDILKVLTEHGFKEIDMNAFKALKSEYLGRQIMGASLVSGTMLMAANGMLTGNGPQDAAERRRLKEIGWQELSIKNPFTGKWHSYKGFEPFAGILGLSADFVYQSSRVDQAMAEDWPRKLAAAISLNVTNATFLSGFEPLAGLMTNDETAWNRYLANMANSVLPGAGARSVLNNIITPQLKDVENDFLNQLANKNKFLFPGDSIIKNAVDLYTGEPIRYYEPLTAAANAFMPAFKSNGGMEPWRQWLLSTGWDNLQVLQTNPLSKEPIKPEAQQWINNWLGGGLPNKDGIPKPGYRNPDGTANPAYPLRERIEEMMNRPDGFWTKKIKEYQIGRGDLSQNEFPIKQLVVHQELNELHRKARKAAWEAYKRTQAGQADMIEGGYKRRRDDQLKQGDITGARATTEEMLDILSITK